MLTSQPEPEEVLAKIVEIKRYYDACGIQLGGSARISRSMLAFSLGFANTADVDPLLQELHRQGKVAAMNGDDVVFAPLTGVDNHPVA